MTNYYGKPSAPPRLVGRLLPRHISMDMQNGLYVDGEFMGEANGWYDQNLPGMVPDGYWQSGTNTGAPGDGVWSGGTNQGLADGWYQLNVRVVLQDGIWIGEAYHGVANGWYASNVPAPVPDGYWQSGAVVPVPDGYWSGGSIGIVPSGVWQGGANTGLADGWYVANLPAQVPNGLWVGGVNTGPVGDGLWAGGANTGPLSDGIYVGQAFEGVAQGYYVDNSPAPIPDGCYRNGGLVDPYYERIRDAALAEGGGLYLFQLEHGQYAGEQVIWQEMGEVTPWTPGQGLPQGKTYDLMGSGEYLGQSVSMRRPVDGVWDGVNSSLIASSMAIGAQLHQSKGSAWFMGVEMISYKENYAFLASSRQSGANGTLVGNRLDGVTWYRRSGSSDKANNFAYNIGLNDGLHHTIGGVVGGDTVIYMDGIEEGRVSMPAAYADTVADNPLVVGARATNQAYDNINAKISYIAIYTREPTAYEISLHKRTP